MFWETARQLLDTNAKVCGEVYEPEIYCLLANCEEHEIQSVLSSFFARYSYFLLGGLVNATFNQSLLYSL